MFNEEELLLPEIQFGRRKVGHPSREPDENINQRTTQITITRQLFETKEQFMQRVRVLVDNVCYSMAQDILESQECDMFWEGR